MTTKKLLEGALKELRFEKLRGKVLLNIIDEVKTLSTDPIVLAIIKNGLERRNLDTIIHNRLIK